MTPTTSSPPTSIPPAPTPSPGAGVSSPADRLRALATEQLAGTAGRATGCSTTRASGCGG
jgi:hypothetical protein